MVIPRTISSSINDFLSSLYEQKQDICTLIIYAPDFRIILIQI